MDSFIISQGVISLADEKIIIGGKTKRRMLQPKSIPNIDDLLIDAIWKSNPERAEIEVDESGSIIIDKDKEPELYDWAKNG